MKTVNSDDPFDVAQHLLVYLKDNPSNWISIKHHTGYSDGEIAKAMSYLNGSEEVIIHTEDEDCENAPPEIRHIYQINEECMERMEKLVRAAKS